MTPSLLRTLQASVASAAQFKSMRCLARIHHFGPRLLKKQRRFALESPLFFLEGFQACAHILTVHLLKPDRHPFLKDFVQRCLRGMPSQRLNIDEARNTSACWAE